jgi:nucleoside phosphorylase
VEAVIAVTTCYGIEARWIEHRTDLRLVRTPIGERAAEAMEALLEGGLEPISALVSTGFCGGLLPELRIGDLVLADVVRHRGEEILVSPKLLQRAKAALVPGSHAPRTGTCESVPYVADGGKKRDFAGAGAISVDMESGPLARWARREKVPFLSLRAVLDPLDVDLPFSVDDSHFSVALRHPILSLRLARSTVHAGRRLGRALNDLMPALQEGP